MQIPIGLVLSGYEVFILIFVRMTGLFVIAPIFGRRNIPTYYKIGFSFMLALVLMNTTTIPNVNRFDSIYDFAIVVFKEFMVGITIGYVSYLVFTAIYLAGQLIDMQIGFGMVSVLDPVSNIQVPVTSNLYFMISMLIFLAFNGHHALIRALFESYNFIPIGGAIFSTDLLNDILRAFGNIFTIGFKISSPIIAAILISDIALGVISRSVPQLNVFVVGMPLKIILGILVVIVTMPMYITVIDILINDMNSDVLQIMKDMGTKK